jgi:hypothetical protein
MKVCKKHLKYIAVGITYQLVSMNQCEICEEYRPQVKAELERRISIARGT